MDCSVMYKGGQVPATHIVTVIAEANTEFMEWEKGNVRGFIFEEIESCHDTNMKEISFYKKTMKVVFCVVALVPPYRWSHSWDAGDPYSPKTIEVGIAIERMFSLDRKMEEKIPFIIVRSIKMKAERIF